MCKMVFTFSRVKAREKPQKCANMGPVFTQPARTDLGSPGIGSQTHWSGGSNHLFDNIVALAKGEVNAVLLVAE